MPGLHAARLVRARPDPRPEGDGDRRRDRDHRRLRADHPRGRLRQPGLGDGARRRSARCPCYAVIVWRPRTRVDETLDVLAAHGIAGFTGILFIGFFAQAVVERRLGRPRLRQRGPARRPGAGGARGARLRLRGDLRAAEGDRRCVMPLRATRARGGARAGRHPPRRGGLRRRARARSSSRRRRASRARGRSPDPV